MNNYNTRDEETAVLLTKQSIDTASPSSNKTSTSKTNGIVLSVGLLLIGSLGFMAGNHYGNAGVGPLNNSFMNLESLTDCKHNMEKGFEGVDDRETAKKHDGYHPGYDHHDDEYDPRYDDIPHCLMNDVVACIDMNALDTPSFCECVKAIDESHCTADIQVKYWEYTEDGCPHGDHHHDEDHHYPEDHYHNEDHHYPEDHYHNEDHQPVHHPEDHHYPEDHYHNEGHQPVHHPEDHYTGTHDTGTHDMDMHPTMDPMHQPVHHPDQMDFSDTDTVHAYDDEHSQPFQMQNPDEPNQFGPSEHQHDGTNPEVFSEHVHGVMNLKVNKDSNPMLSPPVHTQQHNDYMHYVQNTMPIHQPHNHPEAAHAPVKGDKSVYHPEAAPVKGGKKGKR